MKKIKKQFPILSRKIDGVPLVYLDNAATTQKPKVVIDAITHFYTTSNANVHRSLNVLGHEATTLYEKARKDVAFFIRAKSSREIIFTQNATYALNLVVKSYMSSFLKEGDTVVLCKTNHHSHIIPWIQLAKEKQIRLVYLPMHEDATIDMEKSQALLRSDKTIKVLAMTHISNVLGVVNDIKSLIHVAKEQNMLTVIDMAQSICHVAVNVKDLQCDFAAFSGHKMFGPTGIGVLYAKEEHLLNMPAWIGGGGMIAEVFEQDFTTNDIPYKFEAGTPPIAQAIGLAKAIAFISGIGMEEIVKHERELTQYAMQELGKLSFVKVHGPINPEIRIPVISFSIEEIHGHDIADFLGQKGIIIRAGHHCAKPLHEFLGAQSTARMSLSIYNTKRDIDKVIRALKELYSIFSKL